MGRILLLVVLGLYFLAGGTLPETLMFKEKNVLLPYSVTEEEAGEMEMKPAFRLWGPKLQAGLPCPERISGGKMHEKRWGC